MRISGSARLAICVAVIGVAGLGAPVAASKAPSPVASIEVLSNRADLLTGGDALVEVAFPASVPTRSVHVLAGDREVTNAFRPSGPGRLRGLVTGLPVGTTRLVARVPGGGAQIDLRNHPVTGPLFSGPHHSVWLCETESQGLGPSRPPSCEAPTQVQLFYRNTGDAWVIYDPASPPSDVKMTTTDDGRTVPFIVRQEVGTLNRGIYAIATLWDPKATTPSWSSDGPWNDKLIFATGAGVNTVPRQGNIGVIKPSEIAVGYDPRGPNGSTNYPAMLARGFAIATNSLDVGDVNANGVLAAESMMMTKERVIELLGPIRYTIGSGGSGGSMTQNNISAAYPGLLDGLVLGANFMEVYTDSMDGLDFEIMHHYFNGAGLTQGFTPTQMRAVMGNQEISATTINSFLHWYNPESCEEADWSYRAATNPTGFRCTLMDHQKNVFGARPPSAWESVEKQLGRGFAPRPYDNVGVQYGLNVLRAGQITPAQFIDLNEKALGGRTIDEKEIPTPQRQIADPEALEIGYRTGRIPVGTHWGDLPILDLGGDGNIAIHLDVRGLMMRDRVRNNHGSTDNYVRWKFDGYSTGLAPPETGVTALGLMDRWLAGMEKDQRDVSKRQKVLDNKPADAVDRCHVYEVPVSEDPATCDALYPTATTPRITAGAPLRSDIHKCQLKPVDPADYEGASPPMTDEQLEHLRRVFPTGVCDWTKPGVGYQQNVSWLTFADGPGGRSLGPPPASVSLASGAGLAAPGAGGAGLVPAGRSLPATGSSAPATGLAVALLGTAALFRRRSGAVAAR
jgi:hypothetical protein